MPSWNEAEYVRRANDIAREFVVTKKPLNDLCEKIARDETLNPDEIRTLVRLSNVAAFQQLFKEREGDKMVEFDVGNPESVITRMQSAVTDPPQTANIHNDKLAYEIPDQMCEIRLGHKFEGAMKVAHEDVPERPMRRDYAIIAARKLAQEFDIEKHASALRYEAALDAIHDTFRQVYQPDWGDFVKSAYAEYGEDARPELEHLCHEIGFKYAMPTAEKIAFLQDRHVSDDTAELRLLKEALDARHAYVKCQRAAEWLKRNTPVV